MKKYLDAKHRIRRDYGIINPMNVYCISAALCLVVLLACFLCSRGTLIERYFFRDTKDTGMDFFHSIEYTRGRKPYEIFDTLYPPLANLFFYVLYLMLPVEYTSQWPFDFSESVGMRATELDLRVHQSSMLTFIAFILLSALLLYSLIEYALHNRGLKTAKWTAVFMTLSYGCMYALERGNIIILCAGLSMVFALFYKSENKFLKEIALLSLAFAAGFKLYPALLGILLIREKDWKAAIRAVIYGVAALILPLFAFEGLSALKIFFGQVTSFGESGSVDWTGTSFSNGVNHVLHFISSMTGTELTAASFVSTIGTILCLAVLACALILPKKWQAMLAVTLPMVMYQSQGHYALTMFLIPLAIYFQEEDQFSRQNIVPFIGMTLLTVHLPLFYTYNVSQPRHAVVQLTLVLLCVWCLITAVCYLFNRKSRPASLSDKTK